MTALIILPIYLYGRLNVISDSSHRVSLCYMFVDLSAFEVVHKSDGAEMDSADSLHCAHLCHVLLDLAVVLQQ